MLLLTNLLSSSVYKVSQRKAQVVLDKLIDPYHALAMACILPLLELVDALIQFAQTRDVYVCDFVGALQICLTKLFALYISSEAFSGEDFLGFQHMVNLDHDQIQLKWSDMDLNTEGQHLCFIVGSELILAVHNGEKVSREGWASITCDVKAKCKGMLQLIPSIFFVVWHLMSFDIK